MRDVPDWVGRDDNHVPPDHVRVRVFDSAGGRCHVCYRKIRAGEYWQLDHVLALCNGGENREKNLSPACKNCCYAKTAKDVAEKSKIASIRSKHILPKRKKWSKFKRKMDGSVVLR